MRQESIRHVKYKTLIVAMARYIRKKAKEHPFDSETSVDFNFIVTNEFIKMCFNDTSMTVMHGKDKPHLNADEIIRDALKESGCDGFVTCGFNGCTVTLIGKPCKEFCKLHRLVRKYSGTVIEWNDIKTEVDGKTAYLCHNPEECQRAIDFIKGNKLQMDTITAEKEDEEGRTTLSIAVKTPHGKVKKEETFSALGTAK